MPADRSECNGSDQRMDVEMPAFGPAGVGEPGMTRENLLNRALGMLAGVAVGDAMGMPTEFLTPEQIRAWYGEIRAITLVDQRHPHSQLPLGSVTDDTDQTMIVAELLLEEGRMDPQALAERLLGWSVTDRVRHNRFIGPSTSKALTAIADGAEPREAGQSGNTVGAAMRIAPLAIALPDRETLVKQVVATSMPTHYTQIAISGAMAMAFALTEALRSTATVPSIALAAQEGAVEGRRFGAWSWNPPIERRIARAVAFVEEASREEALSWIYEMTGVGFYPWELVPSALALVCLTDGNPMAAVRVAANLGGDTDTLGSMVGSICGALRGAGAFDPKSVEQVAEVNRLDIAAVAYELVALRDQRTRESAL